MSSSKKMFANKRVSKPVNGKGHRHFDAVPINKPFLGPVRPKQVQVASVPDVPQSWILNQAVLPTLPPTPSESKSLTSLDEDDVKSLPEDDGSSSSITAMVHSKLRMGGRMKGGSKSLKGDGTTFSLTAQTIPHMKYRFPDNAPYKFIQTSETLATLTQSNSAFVGYAVLYTSSNINQFSSFSAVFDQYKITQFELWVLPRHTNPLSVSSTGNVGLLYSLVDYDDAATPTGAAYCEQYSNCVVSPSYEGHYRRAVPHIAVANYAGTFTGYTNMPCPWIDCSTTACQFYCMKIGVSQCDATSDEQIYDLITRVHVEFRNVR
jgi:hypothetical protein